MIFLDASFILRGLVRPATPQDERKAEEAAVVFRRAGRGDAEVTTSDAVLAEVAFVLTSPRQYGLLPADAVGRIKALVTLRGFRLADKRIVLRALDLWATHPKLGFVDALTAAYAQQTDAELATFDSDFDALPDIVRYRP